MTIGSPLKKTAFLLLLTTLTITLGASLSWDNPTGGDHIPADAELNVTGDAGQDVEFYYDEGDGWESFGAASEPSDGVYTTTGIDSDLGSIEDLELKANSSSEETPPISVTLDKGGPSIDIQDDLEFVGEDQDITIEVSDEYSDIDSELTVTADDNDVIDTSENIECDSGDTCEEDFEMDTGGLDEGDEIDITADIEDTVGNPNSEDFSFTLDSGYDGDTSADVYWEESDSAVLSGFEDEDQNVVVSLEGDSVSDTSVTCLVDGEEVDSETQDASGEDTNFECGFDHDDYSSSKFDLSIEVQDEAGNEEGEIESTEMIWDTQTPTVTSLEHPNGISTFNSDFNLTTYITDDASGVESIEYFFNGNTMRGDGNSVSLENPGSLGVETEFQVEPDMGQGNHTVFVRAIDGTGKWSSSITEFDFEYYPDRDPEVNLGAPESFEVTSGESSSFTLNIENEAPFYLNGVEIDSDSVIWNGTVSASGLENGDSVEKTVNVDASRIDPGSYELVLESSTGESATVDVTVRANSEQQSSIDEDVQNWVGRMNSLEENISKINTLDSENEDVSSFTEKVRNAQSAVENGNYYQASSHLQDIDSSFDQASETYSESLEQHKKNKRNQMFLIAFFLVVVLGGGGVGGYLYYNGKEELPEVVPDDWEIDVPDEIPELGVVEKVKELVNGAEEEVEDETGYKFEGFD